MKPIDRGEILGLADYETVRERFRARVIAEKKLRRAPVGPKASVVFENRDTVLLQIQEMLRTERITRPAAIQHEVDTYNELLPDEDELSCTLMIEIADREEREAFLRAAKGLERHVWLVAGAHRLKARASERWADGPMDRTTAVHYLKFALPGEVATALRDPAGRPAGATESLAVAMEIDHPAYTVRAALRSEMLAAIGEDLQD
jgi:Protein of unknown function (DUF3501)